MIPPINATQIQGLAQGSNIEIVSNIFSDIHFLYPLIALVAIPLLLYFLIGIIVGNKSKLITYPMYWFLFIPFLLQIFLGALILFIQSFTSLNQYITSPDFSTLSGSSFEIISTINQSCPFLAIYIALVGLPLLLFFLIGLLSKARVRAGKPKVMLFTYHRYWYLFIAYLLQIFMLFFVILFPVYYLFF